MTAVAATGLTAFAAVVAGVEGECERPDILWWRVSAAGVSKGVARTPGLLLTHLDPALIRF